MPNFFINVKEKGAKKAAGNIKSLTGSMKMMALQAVSVTAVVQGLRKSITMSAEMEGVKKGFDNLAKSSGFSTSAFNKFKAATDGTVSSLELMKQANNAMLLGITDSEAQMASMFDVAQRLGQSLGLDTVQAVESLVTGLGRQSKLMLDNLGIMVDTNKAYEDYADSIGKTTSQLTDQERKTAFVNAAMAEANSLVSSLGEEQLTTADKIAQMQTALGDLAITIGDKVAPIVSDLAGGLAKIVEEISMIGMTPLEKMVKTLEELGADEGLVNALKIDVVNEQIAELNTQLSVGEIQMRVMKSHAQEQLRLIQEDLQWHKKVGGLNDDIIKQNDEWIKDNLEKIESADKELGILLQINVLEAQILAMKKEEGVAVDDIDKKTKKLGKTKDSLTTKELANFAKVSGTAEDAMKSVIKAESMEAVAGLIASILKTVPFPVNVILAAGAGATASGLIDKGLASFATGGDFITNGKQMIMVGDNPSGRERVQVTPLGGDPAPNAPSGGSVTVNVSGNVLSQDFVEGELAENIKEAIRRGTDFGIS